MENSDKNVARAAFAPLPLGWLAGFILIYIWRILASGFRTTVPWGTMSKPEKGFAIFCMMSIAATLLAGSTKVMNLYVDAQVPVALPFFSDVITIGDDFVQARGTWTRHGDGEGSGMGYPVQTSTIECTKAENRCTEARASVWKNVLASEVAEYEVQSWTKESIVLHNGTFCAEEIYTIDLNTKTVSGAGHRIDKPYCYLSPAMGTEWGYRLEKGFPIYWEMRNKARPMLLRVIESFFGD